MLIGAVAGVENRYAAGEFGCRTRLSFETSMHRLGASVVGFSDSSNTSLGKKGETLADTISVISTYVDAIVRLQRNSWR
jgi:aspartate carbamoyltransferase catalytic subunit